MKLKTPLVIAALAVSLPTFAEGGLLGFLGKVGTLLDSMTVRGVDRRYIGAPEKPWQLIVKGNTSQSDLKMKSITHESENLFQFLKGDMILEPRVKTSPTTYAGLWAGYRGYGLGYSWNIGGDKGRILTFGATGGSYGVNMRIHWFDNDEPEVNFSYSVLQSITDEGAKYVDISYSDYLPTGTPIKTRALFLDGYYLFNGKRCSYAAAYDQSVIQKRSAGSLIAGAMYFHSTTIYDTDENTDVILTMNDIGRFKTWQASIGAGYVYNWVPTRGLLVSGMAIPMVTAYNHIKIWRYDSAMKEWLIEEGLADFDDMDESKYHIWPAKENPVESMNSNVTLTFDARLSITYEWNSWLFFNAYGQYNNFHFKDEDFSIQLDDWYINAAIGIRL